MSYQFLAWLWEMVLLLVYKNKQQAKFASRR